MCNDDLCIYQRYNCSNSGVCTATNDPSAPFSSLEECEATGCEENSTAVEKPLLDPLKTKPIKPIKPIIDKEKDPQKTRMQKVF